MYIIIEKTRNFTARLIQFWMYIDALWHCDIPKRTYNHALISHKNFLWEAVDSGVVKTTFDEHYSHKKYKRRFNTKHIFIPLNFRQQQKVLEYLASEEGKKYEFSNFWFHPLKTIFNKWLGQKGDRKFSCYELVIRAINASGKYNFDPYMNPREFYNIINQLQ